ASGMNGPAQYNTAMMNTRPRSIESPLSGSVVGAPRRSPPGRVPEPRHPVAAHSGEMVRAAVTQFDIEDSRMSSTRSVSMAASTAVSSIGRRLALAVVVALGTFAAPVAAQSGGGSQQAFAIRPFVGGYVPTGQQRDFLKGSVFAGGQASWQVIPEFALVGTFGWSPSNDKITSGQPKLDLYQYDLGAELSQPGMWGFSPFV